MSFLLFYLHSATHFWSASSLNPDLHFLHYPITHDSQSGKAEQSERMALHFP
mgnify:CR=1 FL=1